MLQIEKRSIMFDIQDTSKTGIVVSGSFKLTNSNRIQDMHVTFDKGAPFSGDVYYTEEDNNVRCEYNYPNTDMKAEIDSITNDILTQIRDQNPI